MLTVADDDSRGSAMELGISGMFKQSGYVASSSRHKAQRHDFRAIESRVRAQECRIRHANVLDGC
jgi:hypothetical protein